MARGRPNAAPVSLFPFLAVLMCTMGALIVLLVLVSAQVRDDAVAKAIQAREEVAPEEQTADPGPDWVQPEPEQISPADEPELKPLPPVAPLPPAPDLESLRESLNRLTLRVETERQKLEETRTRLATLQAESAAVRRDASMAAARRQKLEADIRQTSQRRDRAHRELASLDAERKRILESIAQSKELILDQQKKMAGGTQFEVVPFEGLRGTARRPIIIECTDKAIRFVSENIELTPGQLVGFTPDNNPLLAGTNQIVQFWASYNSVQANPESEPVPYVLLVVKPSGTVGFYLARKFLAGLGADYGYELVEEDLEYSVPESDPRAREMALAAISELLAARKTDDTAITFSERLDDDGELRGADEAGRGARSFASGTRSDAASGSDRGSRNELAAAAEAGRSFDSRVLRHGPSASDRFFQSGRFRNRQSRSEGSQATAGRNSTVVNRGGLPGGAGKETGQANGPGPATGGTGRGSDGSGSTGGNSPDMLIPVPSLGTPRTQTGTNQEKRRNSFDFSPGPDPLIAVPSSGTGSETANPDRPGLPEPDAPGGKSEAEGAGQTVESPGGSPLTNGLVPRDGTGEETTSPRLPSGDAEGIQSGSSDADRGAPSSQDPAREPTESRSALTSIESTTHPLLRRSGQPGQTRPDSAGPPGSPSSPSAGPASSLPLPTSSSQTDSADQSPSTIDFTRRPPARTIRRQWGIRNPAGTIALEKPIVIRVEREKVVIDEKLKITRTVERSSDQISEWTLLAIDRVAREWGVPPDRFYWVPAVTLVIEPGGELMRGPLDARLRRNGVSVETRFSDGALPSVPPRTGGIP